MLSGLENFRSWLSLTSMPTLRQPKRLRLTIYIHLQHFVSLPVIQILYCFCRMEQPLPQGAFATGLCYGMLRET